MKTPTEKFNDAALAMIEAADKLIVSATATDVRFGKGTTSKWFGIVADAKAKAIEAGILEAK